MMMSCLSKANKAAQFAVGLITSLGVDIAFIRPSFEEMSHYVNKANLEFLFIVIVQRRDLDVEGSRVPHHHRNFGIWKSQHQGISFVPMQANNANAGYYSKQAVFTDKREVSVVLTGWDDVLIVTHLFIP